MEGSGFDSHDGKSGFFRSNDRHVNSLCFFRMILVRLVSVFRMILVRLVSELRARKSVRAFINLTNAHSTNA
jgi:hypothetical protein